MLKNIKSPTSISVIFLSERFILLKAKIPNSNTVSHLIGQKLYEKDNYYSDFTDDTEFTANVSSA